MRLTGSGGLDSFSDISEIDSDLLAGTAGRREDGGVGALLRGIGVANAGRCDVLLISPGRGGEDRRRSSGRGGGETGGERRSTRGCTVLVKDDSFDGACWYERGRATGGRAAGPA